MTTEGRYRLNNEPVRADEYFDRLLRWLDLESEAEKARLAQRRQLVRGADVERTGEAIVDLQIVEHRTGLGGRYLLTFAKRRAGLELPWNRLKVGSPVIVSDSQDEADEGLSGVVSRRTSDRIEVALEQWPGGDRFRIDLSPDETTRRRQRGAIAAARNASGRAAKLRDCLFGYSEPRFGAEPNVTIDSSLNEPQIATVKFALSAKDFAIIHGPPGTGKTTTLVEVIRQAVAAGARVLACASSNTAVDNLLERLIPVVPQVVRMGHPARVTEACREHTLDELVRHHETQTIIRDMMRESEGLMRQAAKTTRSREGYRRASQMRSEARALQNQVRMLERQAIQYVMNDADVICSTTTIDDELLGDRRFDLVVIDEACQSTEASVWQAILRAERIVFAGDHCQLPPTILSEVAAREGMRLSLQERLIQQFGDNVFRRLTVQYRMHEAIMRFSSKQFYENTLIAHPSVAQHLLSDDAEIRSTPWTSQPITFIDTAGAEYDEAIEPDGLSKLNPREAEWVVRLVRALLQQGIERSQIAIIVPYAAQVRKIRSLLHAASPQGGVSTSGGGPEVDTVDGFQGREKDVVIMSMVRSNDRREIGFMSDTRRTNVALTRARKRLIVIGDSATFASDPFYLAMFEYFESMDSYESIWNYNHDGALDAEA